jgi:thiol-disulfide isomerase/thioredoxin
MKKVKNRIAIIILSVLLVLSLAFNVIMIAREYRVDFIDLENELQVGDMAPDFSVQLLTGETFTLSEHRGTVVVLYFWATWCGPCVATMPSLQDLSEQYEDRVLFVGMNIAESLRRVTDFIDERGFTFPIGLDEVGDIHRDLYPSAGIPYMVIVDGDGVITEIFLGGGDGMHSLIENAILDALD